SQEVFETGFITPSAKGAANITRKSLAQHEYDSMNEIFDVSRDPGSMKSLDTLETFAGTRTQRSGFLAPSLLAKKTSENKKFISMIDDMIKEATANLPEGDRRDAVIARLEKIKASVESANESNAEFSKEHYNEDTEKAKGSKSSSKKKNKKSKSTGSEKKYDKKMSPSKKKYNELSDEISDAGKSGVVDGRKVGYRTSPDEDLTVFTSKGTGEKDALRVDAIAITNEKGALYTYELDRAENGTLNEFHKGAAVGLRDMFDFTTYTSTGAPLFRFENNVYMKTGSKEDAKYSNIGSVEDLQGKVDSKKSSRYQNITQENIDFLLDDKNDLSKMLISGTKYQKGAPEHKTATGGGTTESTTEPETEETTEVEEDTEVEPDTEEEVESVTVEEVIEEGAEAELFPNEEESSDVIFKSNGEKLYSDMTPNQQKLFSPKGKEKTEERTIYDTFETPFLGSNTAETIIGFATKSIQKILNNKNKDGDVQTSLDYIRGLASSFNLVDIIKQSAPAGYTTKNGFVNDTEFIVHDKVVKNEDGEITFRPGQIEKQDNYNPLSMIATGVTETGLKSTGKRKVYTFSDQVMEIVAMNAIYAYQEATQLKYKDQEGIAAMFGLNENSDGDADALVEAMELVQAGQIPYQAMVSTVGANIFGELGLKFDKKIDVRAQEQLEKALGMLAMNTLISSGLLSQHESGLKGVDMSLYRLPGQDKPHRIIQVNEMGDTKEKREESANQLADSVNILKYVDPNIRGNMPMPESSDRVNNTVRGETELMPETAQDFVKHEQKTGYEFNDMSDVMMAEDTPENRQTLALIAGWKDVENMPANKIVAQMSINNQIIRDIDGLFEFKEAFTDPDTNERMKMHIMADMTKSYRFMMDNEFNPQASKISRFLTGSKDMLGAIVKASEIGNSNPVYNTFLLGVAQGLDLDPDKLSDYSVMKKMNDLIQIKGKKLTINEDAEMGKELAQAVKYFDGKGELSDLIPLADSGEHYHAVQAAKAISDLKKAVQSGTDFKHDMALESDGITSGMALTLMQIGS
ncbi:MAG: hypothetical protein DRQ78_11585, partial [Epsilonproteobacteria bacterium]